MFNCTRETSVVTTSSGPWALAWPAKDSKRSNPSKIADEVCFFELENRDVFISLPFADERRVCPCNSRFCNSTLPPQRDRLVPTLPKEVALLGFRSNVMGASVSASPPDVRRWL